MLPVCDFDDLQYLDHVRKWIAYFCSKKRSIKELRFTPDVNVCLQSPTTLRSRPLGNFQSFFACKIVNLPIQWVVGGDHWKTVSCGHLGSDGMPTIWVGKMATFWVFLKFLLFLNGIWKRYTIAAWTNKVRNIINIFVFRIIRHK